MQEVNAVNCHLCYNDLPVHYNRFQFKIITRPLVFFSFNVDKLGGVDLYPFILYKYISSV